MKTTFSHKGYRGSIKASLDDNCLFGVILDINDVITYEAQTVEALHQEFMAAVDDYLETCRNIGKAPQLPVKQSRRHTPRSIGIHAAK